MKVNGNAVPAVIDPAPAETPMNLGFVLVAFIKGAQAWKRIRVPTTLTCKMVGDQSWRR